MRLLILASAAIFSLTIIQSAYSEVRFGRNVRVGGHDFSNQTFNSRRRAVVHLYGRQPRNAGCRWTRAADGARVKVCHLKQLRR
jgi:hypothetical protein